MIPDSCIPIWNICVTLAHSLAAAVSLLFKFYIVYICNMYVRCFKYKISSILHIQNL